MGIEEVILSEFKRIGLEEGRKEGLAEGRAEGQAKGLEEGRAEGRAEGRVEGRVEGRAEGRIQEKIHVIQTGHAAGLSLELLAQLTALSTGQVEKVLRGENLMTAEEEE